MTTGIRPTALVQRVRFDGTTAESYVQGDISPAKLGRWFVGTIASHRSHLAIARQVSPSAEALWIYSEEASTLQSIPNFSSTLHEIKASGVEFAYMFNETDRTLAISDRAGSGLYLVHFDAEGDPLNNIDPSLQEDPPRTKYFRYADSLWNTNVLSAAAEMAHLGPREILHWLERILDLRLGRPDAAKTWSPFGESLRLEAVNILGHHVAWRTTIEAVGHEPILYEEPSGRFDTIDYADLDLWREAAPHGLAETVVVEVAMLVATAMMKLECQLPCGVLPDDKTKYLEEYVFKRVVETPNGPEELAINDPDLALFGESFSVGDEAGFPAGRGLRLAWSTQLLRHLVHDKSPWRSETV